MQMIEVREHCRFVGKGIEKMVADGGDFREAFLYAIKNNYRGNQR